MPLDPALWDITLPAVRAAWAAGLAYVATDQYVPRRASPAYKTNAGGWPATVESDARPDPSSAPVYWRRLFSLKASAFAPIQVSQVPALASAINAVTERAQSDESFGRAMNFHSFVDDVEQRATFLRYEYIDFVSSIIGRASALGVESDDDLLAIYCQLERARFAAELDGDLVVPLTLSAVPASAPVDLGGGVWIEPLDPDFQCARAPRSLGHSVENPYLVAAATHAVVIKGLVINNSEYSRRVSGIFDANSFFSEDVLARVDRVVQSMHIVTDLPSGYNQILVRPKDWADEWINDLPPVWLVGTVKNYPEYQVLSSPWNEPMVTMDAERFAKLPALFKSLEGSPKDVQLAARRSVRAMMRTNDEDRTLDATIGIEALLLSDSAELKYRMAIRAAAALYEEYRPDVVFELARKVYDHRSEISHGNTKPKPKFTYLDQTWKSASIAPLLLRALLRSRLVSSHPWTKDDLEYRVLDALSQYDPDSQPDRY